jgi:hypothetical protein
MKNQVLLFIAIFFEKSEQTMKFYEIRNSKIKKPLHIELFTTDSM